jgi:hypothetical protein
MASRAEPTPGSVVRLPCRPVRAAAARPQGAGSANTARFRNDPQAERRARKLSLPHDTAAPPIPSPTSNRPPLIASSVVTSRAIAKGGWSTKLETSGPSLHLVVRPAITVSTVQPSNHRESGSHGLARWSATQTESAPASSQRPAQSSSSAMGRSCWRKTPNDLTAGTYQRDADPEGC